MKVRQHKPDWGKYIANYMTTVGIPGFRWDQYSKRFLGIKGFSFVRMMPIAEGGWTRVPERFRDYEARVEGKSPNPVIMFLTSKYNGPDIEDSYVMLRLSTFADIMHALVVADPTRFLGEK